VSATNVGTGVRLLPPSHRRFVERTVSVLIADRDQMSSELLATALKRFRQIHVIGSSADSSGLSAAITRRQPEILVISSDFEGSRDCGFKIMRELRESAPAIRLVALLESSTRENVVEAFWSGAQGVFIRSNSVRTLGKCICCVHKGEIWASSEELRHVLESLTRSSLPRLVNTAATNSLTPREQEVLRCLSEGLSNREIAERLGISQHTVKNYLFHIFDKLGVSSRVEALLHTYSPDKRRPPKMSLAVQT
jgi:two-component system, NarL family, nitrate/nitrite response regulator NarL